MNLRLRTEGQRPSAHQAAKPQDQAAERQRLNLAAGAMNISLLPSQTPDNPPETTAYKAMLKVQPYAPYFEAS